jgi:hypothetical protein
MAIKDKGGMTLDVNKAREKLNRDRDAGKVSSRDYKRITKGLNRVQDNTRKGVSYEFTGDGVYKTSNSGGPDISRKDGGVGVNDKIKLFGRDVSKAMGFLQQSSSTQSVPAEEKKPGGSGEGIRPGQKNDNKVSELKGRSFGRSSITANDEPLSPNMPLLSQIGTGTAKQSGSAGTGSVAGVPVLVEPDNTTKYPLNTTKYPLHIDYIRLPRRFPDGYKFGDDTTMFMGDYKFDRKTLKPKRTKEEFIAPPDRSSKVDLSKILLSIKDPIKINPNLTINNALKTVAKSEKESEIRPVKKENQKLLDNLLTLGLGHNGERLRERVHKNELNSSEKKYIELYNKYQKETGSLPVIGRGGVEMKKSQFPIYINDGDYMYIDRPKENINRPKKPHYDNPKVRKFSRGGGLDMAKINRQIDWELNGPRLDMSKINRDVDWTINGPRLDMSKINRDVDWTINGTKLDMNKINLDVEKSLTGNRKTLPSESGMAFNQNSKPFNKDSAINTALGAYGGLSLLLNKAPRMEKPKRFNMAIRPAQGDEGMVDRSNNAITESVRQGANNLRQRTGSDLTSYVQGVTAMTDNAAKAKSGVLSDNAQLKRQDLNRQFGEVNQENQINFQVEEGDRRERMLRDEQRHMGRNQGAQAAVNNSLNYGVQKRADERNQVVQQRMAERRIQMLMLTQTQRWKAEGKTPEEIKALTKEYMDMTKYADGGRLSLTNSARTSIESDKSLAKANAQLRELFQRYSKLIGDASLEQIKQFNQNIRAINQRNNITIARR